MVRRNYEALVSGDGACAGCGEKSILRAAASVTEAYMRPLYHKKADRLRAKAEKLENEGPAKLAALKQRSVPVTYITFPDEGHGFVRPENRLAFYAVTEAFLAKHLGGRSQPVGNDFAGSSLKIETGGELVPGISR